MSKSTAASVEQSLPSALESYKDSANAIKDAYRTAKQEILNDPRLSDLAKKEKVEELDKSTRAKLDDIKAKQESYVSDLRAKLEKELRGSQPTDASSVLLRRDAADRARKIIDQHEAVDMLNDAIANGDESLAHAIGTRALNTGMQGVVDTWKAAFPGSAESAQALAYVESNTSGIAYTIANQITYAAPLD